ncbi:MAG: 4Fe-4S dicluster domain-containing protein [Rikenellaceae bacterium]
MKFKKPKEVTSLEIISDNCRGCGVCIERCKQKVFAHSDDGQKAIVARIENCVGCGKCVEKMCNFGAIKLIVE